MMTMMTMTMMITVCVCVPDLSYLYLWWSESEDCSVSHLHSISTQIPHTYLSPRTHHSNCLLALSTNPPCFHPLYSSCRGGGWGGVAPPRSSPVPLLLLSAHKWWASFSFSPLLYYLWLPATAADPETAAWSSLALTMHSRPPGILVH